MTQVFLHIINMSITASYVVLAVMILRLIIKRVPKWITVALWGIVAFRLVCPFSIESVLSLIPSVMPVSPTIMTDKTPEINTGIPVINNTVNPIIGESFTPNPGDSANPLQVLIPVFTAVWIIGMAALLIYAVISYLRVKRKIGTAVLYKDNIYQSENVVSPFVLGLIKPKIYLPFNMNDKDMSYVLAHEAAHIRRNDHIWKPLGFILLTIYWFNPLIWIGYVLLCRDIELACDEKVIGALDHDERADYSEALLACSVNRRMIAACPLAFGEVGVKDRVKNVLNYKKPALWIIIAALALCAVMMVCFLTNPKSDDMEGKGEKNENLGETDPSKLDEYQISLMEKYPEYFGLDASDGLDVIVWQMAPNSYSFGLLPHGVAVGGMLDTALFSLKRIGADQMRIILSTYSVSKEDIYIVPWQAPYSSYIGNYWIILNGEDTEAKRAAYVENVWDLLSDERTYGAEFSTPELVYHDPVFSWIDSYYSGIKIVGDVLYDLESGEKIGTLSRKYLSSNDLDAKLTESFDPYEGLGDKIRHNTFLSYQVSLTNTPKGVDLYYVIIQSDGTALLVYGHYVDGVKNDTIRWIFNIGK